MGSTGRGGTSPLCTWHSLPLPLSALYILQRAPLLHPVLSASQDDRDWFKEIYQNDNVWSLSLAEKSLAVDMGLAMHD